MQALVRWGPVLGWAALIFFLSHQSRLPVDLEGTDWAAHGLAFGALGLALLWGLSDRGRYRLPAGTLVVAWMVCAAYGALDEFHQSFVPGRVPSFSDLVADLVGALIAVLAASWALRGRPSLSQAD